MKETKEIWSLLKHEAQWDRMTAKQKLLTVWFSLSFVLLGLCGESLLFAVIAVANFGLSAYFTTKYVPMEDE